jgi:hypothetical protein
MKMHGGHNVKKYDTIFINCNWVPNLWQWSVHLYTNKQEHYYTQGETVYKEHRTHKIESKTYKTTNNGNINRIIKTWTKTHKANNSCTQNTETTSNETTYYKIINIHNYKSMIINILRPWPSKLLQFTPLLDVSSLHFYSLRFISLITFLILFLKICDVKWKVASASAGSWCQWLMVLFTKEYFPISVLCFLALFCRTWSSLLR